jgi:hypothetical protein
VDINELLQRLIQAGEDEAVLNAAQIVALIERLDKDARRLILSKIKFIVDKAGNISLVEGNFQAALDAAAAGDSAAAATLAELRESGWIANRVDKMLSLGKVSFSTAVRQAGGKVTKFKLKADPMLLQIGEERVYDLIKGQTDATRQAIKDALMNAMRTNTSRTALAKEIQAAAKGVSYKRAQVIATTELRANYTLASIQMGAENGYTFYEYMGPMDDKTEQVCMVQVGKVRKLPEWYLQPDIDGKPVGSVILAYGLHYGCRHRLVPVDPAWPGVAEKIEASRS